MTGAAYTGRYENEKYLFLQMTSRPTMISCQISTWLFVGISKRSPELQTCTTKFEVSSGNMSIVPLQLV
jgi:hypothetical protein